MAVVETSGVVIVALFGFFVGRTLSRCEKKYWLAGYVFSFALVGLVAVARRWWNLGLVPPFSWAMMGRREFVVMAFACSMLFGILLPQIRNGAERLLVGLLMIWTVGAFCLTPFLRPLILGKELATFETRFDSDGVCLQNTSYTCGPAATVTALRCLGIQGDEGEIAVRAYSNPRWGTETDSLCLAVDELYGCAGVSYEYRTFDSVHELKHVEGVPIVLVKFAFLVDHYVAVLEVTDEYVVLGDPFRGKRKLTHRQFEDIWRFYGVVFTRKSAGNANATYLRIA